MAQRLVSGGTADLVGDLRRAGEQLIGWYDLFDRPQPRRLGVELPRQDEIAAADRADFAPQEADAPPRDDAEIELRLVLEHVSGAR
jgi:hypothetical protein